MLFIANILVFCRLASSVIVWCAQCIFGNFYYTIHTSILCITITSSAHHACEVKKKSPSNNITITAVDPCKWQSHKHHIVHIRFRLWCSVPLYGFLPMGFNVFVHHILFCHIFFSFSFCALFLVLLCSSFYNVPRHMRSWFLLLLLFCCSKCVKPRIVQLNSIVIPKC